MEEGVYVPVTPTAGTASLSSLPVGSSNPFHAKGTNEIERLNKLKKTRNIILKLVQWLYVYYRMAGKGPDATSFVRDQISLVPVVTDSANIYNFNNLIHVLPKVATLEEAVDYLGNVTTGFLVNGKISMYSSKLMDGIKYYLETYTKDHKGKAVGIPDEIPGMFEELSDFKYQRGVRIFLSESDFKIFLYNRIKLGLSPSEIISKISFDYNVYRDPYLYREDNGNIFLIQNVSELNFDRAINVAYTWYLSGVNNGYESPAYAKVESYPPHLIYELGTNGNLVPTNDLTGGNSEYLRVFKYGINQYAAVLPLL